MLAGLLKSDEQVDLTKEGMSYEASQDGVPDLNVRYKPQNFLHNSREQSGNFCTSGYGILTFTHSLFQM